MIEYKKYIVNRYRSTPSWEEWSLRNIYLFITFRISSSCFF